MSVTIGSFRLSPEFFLKTHLVNRCVNECARECCNEGVWLSLYDARRIIERAADLQPYLPAPVQFEAWDLSKTSFITTPLRNAGTPHERCAFLTPDRLCAIHAMALDKNIPLQSIKPYFCLMFPLTLSDLDINVTEITIDSKAYRTCLVEGTEETWLYEQFEPDLRKILGDAGYAEIQRLYPK